MPSVFRAVQAKVLKSSARRQSGSLPQPCHPIPSSSHRAARRTLSTVLLNQIARKPGGGTVFPSTEVLRAPERSTSTLQIIRATGHPADHRACHKLRSSAFRIVVVDNSRADVAADGEFEALSDTDPKRLYRRRLYWRASPETSKPTSAARFRGSPSLPPKQILNSAPIRYA